MITAELDKGGRRILIRMEYSAGDFRAVKQIPGSSWRKRDECFAVPADLETGRKLRQLFGSRLEVGPRLLAWGTNEARKARNLSKISTADDYPLEDMELVDVLPKLAETLWAHQRADAVFMSKTSCINANEQGTGKTRDVIAAVYEGGMQDGFHLVLAPVKSIEATWLEELERWIPDHVPLLASEDPKQREQHVAEAFELYEAGDPFWLVINKEMMRYEALYEYRFDDDRNKEVREEVGVEEKYPELFSIPWTTLTIDEFHKAGLSNPKTLTSRAIASQRPGRLWLMSGTPMRGREINLWGALHLLAPKNFNSKWRWFYQWLDVTEERIGSRQVRRTVGELQEGRDDAFYEMLSPYMVRRLKEEVFPELPPKEYEDVWCYMTPKQDAQYTEFEHQAEIIIEEHHLISTGMLAEYSRLKMFATARCQIDQTTVKKRRTGELISTLKMIPTTDSGKLPYLLEKLQECGVEPDQYNFKALVGSQHRETVMMVAHWLIDHGYRVNTIMGGTGDTRALMHDFQQLGKPSTQIIVATLAAGGVSLNLDAADSVHILDEDWVPDTMDQFEDRAHRGSRMHRVRVFYYRSRDTIEEDIKELNDEKGYNNWNVLDLRRKMRKENT